MKTSAEVTETELPGRITLLSSNRVYYVIIGISETQRIGETNSVLRSPTKIRLTINKCLVKCNEPKLCFHFTREAILYKCQKK